MRFRSEERRTAVPAKQIQLEELHDESIVRQRSCLTFAQKLARLRERLSQPQWRCYGTTLFAGKLAGVGLTLLVMAAVSGLFFARVYAADSTPKAADIINPVNTAWTLIAAFLVFGMQVGFTTLEAGLCRFRETVNVLMECIVDTCLCGILFYAIGLAFMFSHGNGFIGYHWFFLQGAPDTYESTGVVSRSVDFPVCIRGHLLHDHFRGDDRPYGLCRRSDLLARRLGLHLSDHWSLGMGPRWISSHDGLSGILLT